jgi:SHS2 domain-containing protein
VINHYEILEHTADVGLRVRGQTLEALFEHAAQGLYALALTTPPASGDTEKVTLHLAGDSPETLLVAFLEEMVYRLYSRRQIAVEARVSFPSPNYLTVEAAFTPVTAEAYAAEVKSPTYHRLKVEQNQNSWMAEVYFDL